MACQRIIAAADQTGDVGFYLLFERGLVSYEDVVDFHTFYSVGDCFHNSLQTDVLPPGALPVQAIAKQGMNSLSLAFGHELLLSSDSIV